MGFGFLGLIDCIYITVVPCAVFMACQFHVLVAMQRTHLFNLCGTARNNFKVASTAVWTSCYTLYKQNIDQPGNLASPVWN